MSEPNQKDRTFAADLSRAISGAAESLLTVLKLPLPVV